MSSNRWRAQGGINSKPVRKTGRARVVCAAWETAELLVWHQAAANWDHQEISRTILTIPMLPDAPQVHSGGLSVASLLAASPGRAPESPPTLHLPSPPWRY